MPRNRTPIVKKLTADDLSELIWSDRAGRYANRHIGQRLRYFHACYMRTEFHIAALVEKKVIGLLGIEDSPHEADTIWLKHISVDEDWWNRRVGSCLVAAMFDHLETRVPEGRTKLLRSRPSQMGEAYIGRVVERYARAHPSITVLRHDYYSL